MNYRKLMETVEMSQEEMINYYKKEQAAQAYGWEFFQDEMYGLPFSQRDGTPFIHNRVLPLFFFDSGFDRMLEKVTGKKINRAGEFSCSGVQSQIEIPLDGKRPNLTPKLKETIRHEIIHYTLWVAGLPYEDDSAEFWCMCYAYDGGAYKIPEVEDKKKYIGVFCTLFREHVKKQKKRFLKKLMIGNMILLISTTPVDEYEAKCLELIDQVIAMEDAFK